MERFIEAKIKTWYTKKGRKPLVIRGARQVGKSWLVRQFARHHNLQLYEVNLERNLKLQSLFQNQNIDDLLREFEFICRKGPIKPWDSLVFIDEIQAIPAALQTLRYFYEDYPDLPVIAAGSLLEFTLAKHTFSMPVGRIEYIFMGPVSFEEFLNAQEEKQLSEYLLSFQIKDSMPQAAHERLLQYQREYLLLGGMPEAVQHYIEDKDMKKSIEIQQAIIETYRDDFSKYANQSELVRLQKVFDAAPLRVGEKFKYASIDANENSRELKRAVELLTKAGLILKVFHTDASGIPLRATIHNRVFKVYFLDCGLMNRICGINWLSLSSLKAQRFINEGKMAEQFIAQHLWYRKSNESPFLCYWLREGRLGNAEVDFLIQNNDLIIPIEVKAGKSGRLKSLQQFVFQKKVPLAVRFYLGLPSKQHVSYTIRAGTANEAVDFILLSLPLYFIEQLPRLLQEEQIK